MSEPTEEESRQEFTFERESADGTVREVEFTSEADRRIATFVADWFASFGVTGVRWVDEPGAERHPDGAVLRTTEEGVRSGGTEDRLRRRRTGT